MQTLSTPSLYEAKKTLSKRERNSVIWIADNGFVYKKQPKYLTDNEWHALRSMGFLLPRFVPVAWRVEDEIIRMEFIEAQPITNTSLFMSHYDEILRIMRYANLRHGDLTEYSVIPHKNRPILIDWAESRTWDDPRPDKRREGDAYWLKRTMEKLCTS